ncbi:unnamed protein product [Rhodiola kirilowii]
MAIEKEGLFEWLGRGGDREVIKRGRSYCTRMEWAMNSKTVEGCDVVLLMRECVVWVGVVL